MTAVCLIFLKNFSFKRPVGLRDPISILVGIGESVAEIRLHSDRPISIVRLLAAAILDF